MGESRLAYSPSLRNARQLQAVAGLGETPDMKALIETERVAQAEYAVAKPKHSILIGADLAAYCPDSMLVVDAQAIALAVTIRLKCGLKLSMARSTII